MNAYQKIIDKIFLPDNLAEQRKAWKQQAKTVVFTNGCFDLIHAGHIDYLSKAAGLGHKLIIGLNSDASVKKIKGQGRPVNDEKTRSLVLASFLFTDAIVLFDDETPLALIRNLQPDILVKGGDYEENDIVGANEVKLNGGKVIILPFIEGYSSSKIIDKILKK